MINFKANYINSTNIYKINGNNNEKYPVNFVELNAFNENDRRAALRLARDWNNGFNDFSCIIAIDMKDDYLMSYKDKSAINAYQKEAKYYALTSQTKDFDLLDFKKIFAIAEVNIKNGMHSIRYLQAHPEHNMLAENPGFCRIGSKMLDMIKKIFPQQDIILTPTEYSKKFYKLNGFVKYGKSKMIFRHK